MVRYKIALILIIFTLKVNSQNLVLNPSFEEYNFLPQKFLPSNKHFCANWYDTHWSRVGADYYHKLSKDSDFSVPNNYFGIHPARTGNAYVGLVVFDWDGGVEHITGSLSEPLKKDSIYLVKYHLRFAGKYSHFYMKEVGILFSKTKNPFNPGWADYEQSISSDIVADIKNSNDISLSNDSIWVEISGKYIAKGGEKYLTIGLFYNENVKLDLIHKIRKIATSIIEKDAIFQANQEVLIINKNYVENENFNSDAAYYFIDDVSVKLIKKKITIPTYSTAHYECFLE